MLRGVYYYCITQVPMTTASCDTYQVDDIRAENSDGRGNEGGESRACLPGARWERLHGLKVHRVESHRHQQLQHHHHQDRHPAQGSVLKATNILTNIVWDVGQLERQQIS